MHAHLLWGGIGLSSPRCNACFAASAVLESFFYRGAAPPSGFGGSVCALRLANHLPKARTSASLLSLWFSGLCHRLNGSAIATEKPEPPPPCIRHRRQSASVPLAAVGFGSHLVGAHMRLREAQEAKRSAKSPFPGARLRARKRDVRGACRCAGYSTRKPAEAGQVAPQRRRAGPIPPKQMRMHLRTGFLGMKSLSGVVGAEPLQRSPYKKTAGGYGCGVCSLKPMPQTVSI